jgi:hypothetical protein
MLPEDGRRPKHVGVFKYFSVCFLNTENISAFVGIFLENRSGLFEEDNNLLFLTGIEPKFLVRLMLSLATSVPVPRCSQVQT